MDNYTLEVFNTITCNYEVIVVSEKVYKAYLRDLWSTKQKDKRYYKHNITASFITRGDDEFFEKYDSFVCECEKQHQINADSNDIGELVNEALKILSTRDRNLIQALFYEGLTEKEYANKLGIDQSTVHRRKKRILRQLKKEMEKFS